MYRRVWGAGRRFGSYITYYYEFIANISQTVHHLEYA
jgi:hypothetical protein